MAKVFIGNTGYKMTLGNTKVKRGYLGNTLVYSGDIEVVYHVDEAESIMYTETVEEGYTCLSPSSFNPDGLKPGYKFLGWRSDRIPSSQVYTELIAGDENLDLYAVYYKDITVNFYNASLLADTKYYKIYYNNSNFLYPRTNEDDLVMNPVAGYENSVGWTDVKNSDIQKWNNGSVIEEIKSDMNLYSVYSKNVTIYIVNGSNDGPIKSTIASTRYRQYNETEVYTDNPSVTITHNNVSNWSNFGWNITLDSKNKVFEDGLLRITELYDNKTIYALYSQPVTCRVINGSNNGSITTNINETRYRQYNSSYTDIHPVINISHGTVSGFSSDGWNITVSDYTSKYPDGNLTLNNTFDGKSIMALYKQSVFVTVYNGNANLTKATGNKVNLTRKRQYNSSGYTDLNPTTNLTHANISGWSNYGWNIQKNSTTRSFNDGTFTVTSAYDGKNIYALYSMSCTVSIYNGVTITQVYIPNKTTVTKTAFIQFNESQVARNGETFNLSHASISGWSSAGWNMNTSSSTATMSDGNIAMDYTYNGKSIYALYQQSVTIYLVNAPGGNINRSTVSGTRFRIFYSAYYDFNPTTTLAHGTYSGFTSNGWMLNVATTTTSIQDGIFTITSSYDGKTLYASYKKVLSVTWYNTPGAANGTNMASIAVKENKYMYRTASWNGSSGVWANTYPSFSRAVASYSNWQVLGWTTSTSWVTSPTYQSNTSFTISSDITLYGCYYKPVRLTALCEGSLKYSEGTCYYNRGNGYAPSIKEVALPIPSRGTYGDRDFIGWSTSATSTNIVYSPAQALISLSDSLAIYGVWKLHNWQIINNPSGNVYECGLDFKDRFEIRNIATIDFARFDYINIKCSADIAWGEWASATWSYTYLFPGTIPYDYRGKGNPYDQPAGTKELRAINWWNSGGVRTDRGPCANNVTATINNINLYNSGASSQYSESAAISVGFMGAMLKGKVIVYELWAHGREITW